MTTKVGPPRINVPCNDCVHLPVCAIRQSLMGLELEEFQPPRPHPALGLQMTIEVVCDHHLASDQPMVAPEVGRTKRLMSPEHKAAIQAGQQRRRERQRAEAAEAA